MNPKITDMTLCSGGNHVTIQVTEAAEDGGEVWTFDLELSDLLPRPTFEERLMQTSTIFMSTPPDELYRAGHIYRAMIAIQQTNATEFEAMRAAVLAAEGSA